MEPQCNEVITTLAKSLRISAYLELGIDRCATIQKVKTAMPECYCLGVDINVQNKNGEFDYFEGSTDHFFEQNEKTFDLIFIDADHSSLAAGKDLANSLKFLNEFGVIVMHDMDPAKDELFDHTRCGDCYKLNILFETLDINHITLPIDDEGISIITKKDNLRCAHKL
jgi:hypothetical protein